MVMAVVAGLRGVCGAAAHAGLVIIVSKQKKNIQVVGGIRLYVGMGVHTEDL